MLTYFTRNLLLEIVYSNEIIWPLAWILCAFLRVRQSASQCTNRHNEEGCTSQQHTKSTCMYPAQSKPEIVHFWPFLGIEIVHNHLAFCTTLFIINDAGIKLAPLTLEVFFFESFGLNQLVRILLLFGRGMTTSLSFSWEQNEQGLDGVVDSVPWQDSTFWMALMVRSAAGSY